MFVLEASEPLGGMLIEEKETLKQMTAKLKNKDLEIASLRAQLKKAQSVHVVRGSFASHTLFFFVGGRGKNTYGDYSFL